AQDGYEADDLNASICHAHPKRRKVIVSADSDLYQLLQDNWPRKGSTRVYHPITQITLDAGGFEIRYGINPQQWARLKAIAGCSSDEIPGVPGVGEKTAAKFLQGNGGPRSVGIAFEAKLINRNLQLTTLPFPGV